MFFDITSLPLKVLCTILGSWVNIKSIAYLDSAYCNSRRGNLIHLLGIKELVHSNPVVLYNDTVVRWLRVKAMHISNTVLIVGLEPTQTFIQYFAVLGHSIRRVSFRNQCNALELMYIVACFCKNLVAIECVNVSLPSAFHVILLSNPNIREIWLQECNCVFDSLMTNVSLHKLKTFSMRNVVCQQDFPWTLTTHSTSLERVEYSYLRLFDSRNIVHLAQQCPQLRSFGIHMRSLVDRELISYVTNTHNLINLDVSYCHIVTNISILAAAKCLHYLRTLNVQHCENLTDVSWSIMATHCGNRLEMLYANIRSACCGTEVIIKDFSSKCTRIAYLNIISDYILCATTCAASLIKGCPALRTLVVNKEEIISPTTRELSAIVKPDLDILEHDENTEYNVLVLPI